MKILFLGAGAVGGYWAAKLTQSGAADVTLLLREKRAEIVRKSGLVVKSPKGDFTVPVKVVTRGPNDEIGGGPYDVIVLACKAYDLPSAMDAIAPAVGKDTTIVPMLNGHAHFATLDARFGKEKVAGGLARISGMLGPNGEILPPNDRRRMGSLANRLWHTDASFVDPPGRYSLLSARVVRDVSPISCRPAVSSPDMESTSPKLRTFSFWSSFFI